MTGINNHSAISAMRALPESDATQSLAARLRNAAANGDDSKLQEAAEQFEGYFIQTMLKDMRKTIAIGGEVSGGKEMETWNSMFDEEIAGRIAKGRGLGMASMIVQSMKSHSPAEGHAHALAARTYAGNLPPAARPALGRRQGWTWPLPEHQPGQLSSDFGTRSDPFHGESQHHAGLDVAAPRGTPVLAMADGVVVSAGANGGYGNFVELRHSDGVVTRYAHQARLDVRAGDSVRAGTQLGTVGSTGRATGDHLHLEVWIDGQNVDPYDFLNGEHR